jgi:sterol O-acyltransferase
MIEGFVLVAIVFFVALHFLSKIKSKEKFPYHEYSGIWNFFQIAFLFFLGSHHIRHYMKQGAVWGWFSFFELFSNLNILVIWIILLFFTLFTYPLKMLFISKKYPISKTLRYLLHGFFLLFIMSWTVYLIWLHEDWHFVPKGSLTCQLMVLIMKMHSYLVNHNDTSGKKTEIKGDKKETEVEPKVTIIESKEVEKEILGDNNKDAELNKKEEVSPEPEKMTELTFIDFLYYLIYPTLVFEISYPRTESIRWSYIVEKCGLCLGLFSCLHLVCQFYILPHLQRSHIEPFIESVLTLVVPFCVCVWLVFYVIFDCVCNGVAELTRFANREFNKDWWNSTTMEEFSRRWNLPVHAWLHRHIFLELKKNFNCSNEFSAFVTFLVSSIFHEFILILTFRLVMPYLFLSQMLQIPLIMIGKKLKGTSQGNFFFWAGIIVGIPLLSTLYCREYFRERVVIDCDDINFATNLPLLI